MHLNPQYPNILADMQAAANGRDLRNQRYGIATAKRHLIPRKSYPYASERQVKRQQLSPQYFQTNGPFRLIQKAETGN